MIIEELQKANIEAMKARDTNARAVLSIVLAKYKLEVINAREKGKEVSDNDVIRLLGKTVKKLEEERISYANAGRDEEVANINAQIDLISKYLPKMLSEDEIRAEINKLDDKSIPSVMKHFKMNFDGKVDMALVNKVVRSL